MRFPAKLLVLVALVLITASCGGDGSDTTTTVAATPTTEAATTTTAEMATTTVATTTTEEEEEHEHMSRPVDAPTASITVDGDSSDWADVTGLDMTLEPIEGEDVETHTASLKIAHDDDNLYVLLTVDDDYDWDPEDAHLSAASAIMWAVETAAGPHMGTDADDGEGPSLGMVDIWHWELECGPGEETGGAVAGPGDGDPGNDSGCNFDDEWATDPETREDDNTDTGENSLLGVFHHTDETADAAGQWIFEISRPLQTGDSQDAQFAIDQTNLLALAYWDADNGPEGWDDDEHVQSSNQGWIEVTLVP